MAENKFDEALRKLPLSVCVVTVGRGGVENGLTVSWVMPVSFEPLQFAIAVDQQHYSIELLKSTKSFAINVLRSDQKRYAGHFAKQSFADEDKLDTVPSRPGESGAAILTEALAYYDCEITAQHEVGDHILFVGRVVDAGVLNDGEPLSTTAGVRYVKGKA